MITRRTIEYDNPPASLNWRGNDLIDWVSGGSIYSLNGEFKNSGRAYSYKFDSAIQSNNGVYAVIYEKLGTKGLLLKNGEIIRELNRSFYQANVYEYPIELIKLDNEYSIIHCPEEYNQIEIENVETGLRITSDSEREPGDCFHSRFRVNNSNTKLVNAGWVWHPVGILETYDLQKAIEDNTLFDSPKSNLPINTEVCSAEFLNDDLLIISSSNEEPFDDEDLNDKVNLNPRQLGLFSIEQNAFVKKINVDFKLGTQIPIDENFVIDLYEYPKLIDLNSGEIKQKFVDINSGKQDLAIIHHIEKVPPIAIDRLNRRFAIGNGNKIELLEIE
jgi:hypothetical protein